jgi:hypothetical protein
MDWVEVIEEFFLLAVGFLSLVELWYAKIMGVKIANI